MATKQFIEDSLKPDATMLKVQAMEKAKPKPKAKKAKKKKVTDDAEG